MRTGRGVGAGHKYRELCMCPDCARRFKERIKRIYQQNAKTPKERA